MMPVVSQLPGVRRRDGVQLLVLGFDATHALCVLSDGSLAYVEQGDVTIDWTYDGEAQVWTSSTSTMEELGDTGDLASGGEETEPSPRPDPTVT